MVASKKSFVCEPFYLVRGMFFFIIQKEKYFFVRQKICLSRELFVYKPQNTFLKYFVCIYSYWDCCDLTLVHRHNTHTQHFSFSLHQPYTKRGNTVAHIVVLEECILWHLSIIIFLKYNTGAGIMFPSLSGSIFRASPASGTWHQTFQFDF